MEALNELCDLVAAHPDLLLADKLAWLSSRCAAAPHRASRAHLHSLLALARLLPAGGAGADGDAPPAPPSPLLSFLKSHAFLSPAFWPQSFAPAPFLSRLLPLLAAAPASPALSSALSAALLAALDVADPASAPLARAFLSAAAAAAPLQLLPADAAPVAARLLLEFPGSEEAPARAKGKGEDAVAEENGGVRDVVRRFEEEEVEELERKEVAFRLIVHMLGGEGGLEAEQVGKVRNAAARQVRSLTDFLKIRKRDWREQGAQLRARINTKLMCCQAAVVVLVRSISTMDTDSKSSKDMLQQTLAWFIEATKSCILSSWRKLKICEDLFSTLLNGISQITVSRGGQLLPADMTGSSPGALFEAVVKLSFALIKIPVLVVCLTVNLFQDGKGKEAVPVIRLNVIRLLAELCVCLKKWEVVDMILPLFIEHLEEGDASSPSSLRLRLLDAISRVACLGFEKSYRESIVLMTRSYLDKVKALGASENNTLPSEATTERTETLPAGFLLVASNLTSTKLRSDYRHRLLSLCSDVGLVAESKSGRSGADLMGPLLPAVAEICSDFDPVSTVEPSLLKLFRNLWFYIVLFGLAPPIQKNEAPTKPVSTSLNVETSSAIALQAVAGPYMWNSQWSVAVQRIAQGTPPLVVSSVKWLEDELELNALHNPSSRRGSGNENSAVGQRTALSAALGGRVEVAAMSTISGVKATYLLAVAFLETLRFSCNGGILSATSTLNKSNSAFSCVFEYLLTPNLTPAVSQCLTAVVHRAFETVLSWLEDRISDIGEGADVRESVLSVHACFLIKSMSQRDEHVRDVSVKLLTQLKEKFPQVLWNSSCLDLLLISVHNELTSGPVSDPAWVATVRSLYQKIAREWLTSALSYAPCTTQGLIQENFCKPSGVQRTQHTADVVSLLSEIRICSGKNDWNGIRTANVPAVMDSAAAASGAKKEAPDFNLEVLSTAVVSATVKCNHAGEIAGMRRLFSTMGGINMGMAPPGMQSAQPHQSFDEVFVSKFVSLLQNFVVAAEKQPIDNLQFRETCSQATALLLDHMVSDSRANLEGFSQLIRLLCWCPAYISTPDAMETGIYIWTWLVSAAPSLGPLVLAELVDAWLWTIDTKRGLFASDMNYCGPDAKLRPHLIPGEPEAPPEKDPVEAIIAHRLWLGFFIDRFEVTHLFLIYVMNCYCFFLWLMMVPGRMLQGTMKSPAHFSRHPAATGTFFTAMLLGLKFCSCQSQSNLQKCFNVSLYACYMFLASFISHLQNLDTLNDKLQVCIFFVVLCFADVLFFARIFSAALGWFSYAPEWYESQNKTYAQREAQSVSVFVHFLQNERTSSPVGSVSKSQGREGEHNMADQIHPVWGCVDNYVTAREKRKQLLLTLSQNEADRLETRLLELRTIPEALPFFITPKAVDENSVLLQQLPHWAPCSVTQALEFLTPPYKGHPRVMAYVLRVLETYPPETVTFFMPQLVQSLRYDEQGEYVDESEKDAEAQKGSAFQSLLPAVKDKIIESFTPEARDMFEREFDFFDKVTSISGSLFPLPKEERRAGIRSLLQVVPDTRSRNQMGETTDGGLLEIFQQDYGPVGSPSFEAAREMFMVSSAGYAVASLLLQPKDRHNGNLLFDSQGRLVHIDFGFILEISPGGNMGFESAHFKLSHEMTQLLDPSGTMKSDTWNQFLRLCVKGYLAARRHMNGILTTVNMMVDSGLPCFSRGDPINNLRKRFHPEMNEREAANFMVRTCVDAYNKWTTAGYDLIQYLQQGIEK
ncbi:Phosphatidylinositol 4-kinase alpha 1 [Dichanthelium oligosanthes]|uniref:1-phosphatidylinositol 4-kinase n=1 Tax=Dichanthelium oligosanthes TaxID=888268 RepID=A0A1E5WF89_9POAL|nr:Phosphatidylinositol 4-kinase alpha 1 [Dichanthelium oligosanthes]